MGGLRQPENFGVFVIGTSLLIRHVIASLHDGSVAIPLSFTIRELSPQRSAGGQTPSSEDPRMSEELLAQLRTQLLREPSRFVIFLGAGISASAGIPTAGQIVASLKRRIFTARVTEQMSPTDTGTIDSWCSHNSIPTSYGPLLEYVFRTPTDRRRYFESLMTGCQPTAAHNAIAGFVDSAIHHCGNGPLILTTNFDRLTERALKARTGDFPFISYYETDVSRVPLDGSHPTVLKLHGDYLYEDLANVASELQTRVKLGMADTLKATLREKVLIVLGYSGSDDTIMDSLLGLATSGSLSGVYWGCRPTSPPNARVRQLLAAQGSHSSAILPTDNLDRTCAALFAEPSPVEWHCRTAPVKPLDELYQANSVVPRELTKIETGEPSASIITETELCRRISMDSKQLYLIVGAPGSGTTSILKRIVAYIVAIGGVDPDVYDVGGRSPGWRHRAVSIPATWTPFLEPTGSVACFDGLRHNSESVVFLHTLVEWKRTRPDITCVVVMSSDHIPISVRGAAVFRVNALSDAAIRSMLIENLPGRRDVPELLAHHGPFLDLCRRPLYLRMLTILLKHYGAAVPVSKGELVHRFCSEYVSEWLATASVSATDVNNMLATAAKLEILGQEEVDKPNPASPQVLSELAAGGFVFLDGAQLRFGHILFRDYFGARYLYREGLREALGSPSIVANPKWRGALVLTFALVKAPTELVDSILKDATPYRVELVVEAMREVRRPDDELLRRVTAILLTRFEHDVKSQPHDLSMAVGRDSIAAILRLVESPLTGDSQRDAIVKTLQERFTTPDGKYRRLLLKAMRSWSSTELMAHTGWRASLLAMLLDACSSPDRDVRLESIATITRLELTKEAEIADAMHRLVEDSDVFVAGLAMCALVGPAAPEPFRIGQVLEPHWQRHPFTTMLCFEAFMGALFLRSGEGVGGNGEAALQQLAMGALVDAGQSYLTAYWQAVRWLVTSDRAGFNIRESEKRRFVAIADVRAIGNVIAGYGERIAFAVFLIGQTCGWERVRDVAGSLADLNQRMHVLAFLSELGGGSNVIDAIYRPPEEKTALRNFLIERLNHGSDEMEIYWWTVSSAIEKLGSETYVGDREVCNALLTKLREFVQADNAYATRKVGPFVAMYVPVWPHADKGVYQRVADALGIIGDSVVSRELEVLLPDSPYPEAILGARDRIARREARANAAAVNGSGGQDRSPEDEALCEEYFRKGGDAWNAASYESAAEWFQKAFEIDPIDVNICGNIANCLLAAGRRDEALTWSDKALELDRYNASAWIVKVQIQSEREPLSRHKLMATAVVSCPTDSSLAQLWSKELGLTPQPANSGRGGFLNRLFSRY